MKNPAQQIFKYGDTVWSNIEMDELRKTECLCLNCKYLGCQCSKHLFETCKIYNMALMVTRCRWFGEKEV